MPYYLVSTKHESSSSSSSARTLLDIGLFNIAAICNIALNLDFYIRPIGFVLTECAGDVPAALQAKQQHLDVHLVLPGELQLGQQQLEIEPVLV